MTKSLRCDAPGLEMKVRAVRVGAPATRFAMLRMIRSNYRENSVADIAIVFIPDNPIAFARVVFQTRAIQNRHCATMVIDQAGLPQGAGGDAHAGATNPEHAGKKILS